LVGGTLDTFHTLTDLDRLGVPHFLDAYGTDRRPKRQGKYHLDHFLLR
jgi:hypothetical protein